MLTIGKIINTHGINGELKIIEQTDFPERFTKGNIIYFINANNEPISIEIEDYRTMNKYGLLKIKGYNHIKDAETLKGLELKIKKSEAGKLDEGEYYYFEIIGCEVYTTNNELIGVIDSIMSPGANDVWVVKSKENKEFLIPFIPSVVKHVDISNKRVEIEVMEGLLD
ncbi:MAG TPA: ribosome maturation factor RimM [Pseudogracilibacillus sp.]|nr:ribosome maturation factor RimM [Pseudogracilibacillus sp.]